MLLIGRPLSRQIPKALRTTKSMKRKTKIIYINQKHQTHFISLVFAWAGFVSYTFLLQKAEKSISEEDGLIKI